jgi:hypothetical protein
MMAITAVLRIAVVVLTSIATVISCVSMHLHLSFIDSYVNSNVSEAKLQFKAVLEQLPFEIQRLKEEASTSQASEIEKTRQEVEQGIIMQMEKIYSWFHQREASTGLFPIGSINT